MAHGGTSVAGSFVQTVVLTDVATGWIECVPILVREGALVIEALSRARALFPFPLKGVDFDNDSGFMNDLVVPWCREQGLEVTRARAYRKNDQAWVEQKNGAIGASPGRLRPARRPVRGGGTGAALRGQPAAHPGKCGLTHDRQTCGSDGRAFGIARSPTGPAATTIPISNRMANPKQNGPNSPGRHNLPG